jgi:hypothetical protein
LWLFIVAIKIGKSSRRELLDPRFKASLGSYYEDINVKSSMARYTPTLFILRRFLYTVTIVWY